MNREPAARELLPELEPQPISEEVLREKYLKGDETTREQLFARVARALASVEAPERRTDFEPRFLAHLREGGIGAGRIMSAAGTDIQATLINCFVQPVGDCIQGRDESGYPGIYEALREAAETMRRGGGVGYDFSPSARAARASRARRPSPRGLAATSTCSTNRAPRWRARARAAVRRWACCASTTRTCASS